MAGDVRIRLDIAYDGTDFSGWAVQPGRRTVQGELQAALAAILRRPGITLTVAGRTDAGVHASGQVAHLDLDPQLWDASRPWLLRRLASALPPDVRVRRVSAVPAVFDARFSALWRRYEYRIVDQDYGIDPLRRRFVLGWRRPLDPVAMGEAAGHLLGLHDFAGFCRARDTGTTIRTLQRLDVVREGEEIVVTAQADAFCHSMVRSLVGALLAVGEGRQPVQWPAQRLERDRRADDIPVVPARGLILVEVAYPPDEELAVRSEQTRTRRS